MSKEISVNCRETYRSAIQCHLGKSKKFKISRNLSEKYGIEDTYDVCIAHYQKTGDEG